MANLQSSKKNLGKLEHLFATQYIAQWMDKSGVRAAISKLKSEGKLTAKELRVYFDEHYQEFGWDQQERRRWKRAAVLILRQL